MGKIKVGVAGYGTIGQRLADGVAQQGDMELVGIADVETELDIDRDFKITASEGFPVIFETDDLIDEFRLEGQAEAVGNLGLESKAELIAERLGLNILDVRKIGTTLDDQTFGAGGEGADAQNADDQQEKFFHIDQVLKNFFNVLLDLRLGDGADDTVDQLAALEEEQRRDIADAELHRDIRALIDIAFDNVYLALIFLGHLVDDGRDHAAGAAPGGPEVYDDRHLRLLDEFAEIGIG